MISVIVPVYNSEDYLKECISSILNQTYSDFELILINDGSSDNSLNICYEYSKLSNKIKVFDQVNSGASAARNLGIANSSGSWITFIDSDDFINKTYLEDLLNDQSQFPESFIIQDLNIYQDQASQYFLFNFQNKEYPIRVFIEDFELVNFGYIAGKLFKSSYLKERNLRLDTSLCLAEDLDFYLRYLKQIDSVYLSQRANYNYRQLENSAIRKVISFDSLIALYNKLDHSLVELLKKNGLVHLKNQKIRFWTKSLLDNIYSKNNSVKKRVLFLEHINRHYLEEFKSVYSDSKFMGNIYIFLLKNKTYRIFDSLYISIKKIKSR